MSREYLEGQRTCGQLFSFSFYWDVIKTAFAALLHWWYNNSGISNYNRLNKFKQNIYLYLVSLMRFSVWMAIGGGGGE